MRQDAQGRQPHRRDLWRGAMIKHHRVALYLGWLAGGLAAHLFDVSGWPITAAVGLTSFAVALAAVRWPFV